MIDFIKNSYKFEQELDYMEAKKCFNSAMENLPAFVETIQFIFDRCNGRQTEISEKTIDDAFAYIIDKRSYWCPLKFFLCIKKFSGHQYNFVSFPLSPSKHPYKKLHTYPRIPHVSLQPPFYHL